MQLNAQARTAAIAVNDCNRKMNAAERKVQGFEEMVSKALLHEANMKVRPSGRRQLAKVDWHVIQRTLNPHLLSNSGTL